MKIYANSYDVKVLRVIKKENYPLPAAAQPPIDLEDIDEYTDEQMVVVQVNIKARNLLYNAISGEEYEKILSCDTVKEIWDKREVTYEGTSKAKETWINLLVHDYELFQMKGGESIEEMFARFSKIIGDLKAFGKPYSSGYQVKKFLRSFPTTWQIKVVALESQDLDKLSYDEPQGDLIEFEKTHLKKIRPKKDIANDLEDLEEEIVMVSRNMNRLMRRYRNAKKGRMSSRRTRQYNKQDKNDGKCFECGRYGHVQAECPDLKRKVSRGFNKSKSFGSWNDEDNSKYEEIANLCFMTILKNNMNKYSGCWTDKDTSNDESKEDTENCFMARGKTSEESQKMLNELKRLNREKKDWELKLEVCEIKRDVLQDKVQELQMQLNGLRKSTSHSSVKSNSVTYKSTGKGPDRTKFTKLKEKRGISSQPSKVTMEEKSKAGPLKNFAMIKDILIISQLQDHPNIME
ncbi:uncharacterized protein [Nicotiana tomentosiformis]|uniref:uncharacterized protein n=1 Tax=Nicotiana tomentosiformis TaxID=4098 RepID=UPI00388C7481